MIKMSTIISILRGINVSGKNKIPMVELKAMYEDLKYKNVITYIQSGNVMFSANESDSKTLSKKIEQGILKKFGFNVPVITRTIDQVQATIKKNPFLKDKNIELEKLHVTFLEDNPAADNLKKALEYNYEPDKFTIVGKEVYLHCPNGYGNTKLTNTFFENKLKVRATTRNWRTTNELLRIALEIK
jgi:uncharacterized protein (DUF1697 family)